MGGGKGLVDQRVNRVASGAAIRMSEIIECWRMLVLEASAFAETLQVLWRHLPSVQAVR